MNKVFTLLLFFCFAGFLSAQITIDPGTFESTVSMNDITEFKLKVTNSDADNPYEVWWRVVKGDDFPAEWETTMCDDNLCYLENFDECPGSKPNVFAPGAFSDKWSLKVEPNGVAGSSLLYIEVFSDKDFTNKIGSTDTTAIFTASTTSNSLETNIASLSIYPNPAYDYFQIKHDSDVAKVSLVDVVGREVWTKKHTANKRYQVSDLYKGMYLVRLFNNENKLIKTMRLNKSSI